MNSEAFLAIADAIADPLLLLDASGGIVAANAAGWHLLGLPGGRVRAQFADFMLDPETLEPLVGRWLAGREGRSALRLRSATGRQIECSCQGNPIAPAGAGEGARVLLHCRPVERAGDGAAGPVARLEAEMPSPAEKADLERALRENVALVRELRHRIRNNLQLLLSMLGLAIRDETDERTRHRLQETRNRVLAMSIVQRLVHQHGNVAAVDAAALVRELSGEMGKAYPRDGLALEVDAAPLAVSLETAGPLALIVGELVSNALRHAYPDGRGRVRVELRQAADGGIELTVADEGCGMPPRADRRVSAGLNLARGLAGQLGGELTIEGGKGTRCVLRFAEPSSAGMKHGQA